MKVLNRSVSVSDNSLVTRVGLNIDSLSAVRGTLNDRLVY